MTGRIVFGEGDAPDRYFLDDQEVTEAEFRQGFPDRSGVPGGHAPACWPMTSEALAVHPSQIDVANARAVKHGIDVRYEPGTGLAKIGSRGDRKKLLKLEGFHDKQGGYGDG